MYMNISLYLLIRLLFMHNGAIAHFDDVKLDMLEIIKRTTAKYIKGRPSITPRNHTKQVN